ncbi:MAG: hypothetical protein CUN52_09150 [Phototrophicales bacterium]|nr:MAG: hypothetical protein CUN52_09150 [Phototrophicales bacterium]
MCISALIYATYPHFCLYIILKWVSDHPFLANSADKHGYFLVNLCNSTDYTPKIFIQKIHVQLPILLLYSLMEMREFCHFSTNT